MSIAFDVRALGSTVRIELDDSLSSTDQESIKAHWIDLVQDGDGEPDRVIRGSVRDRSDSIDSEYVIRANSPEALAQRLTSEITTGAINALRGEALMLHASAVALDDGRVIGFVGPSGRGKTTAAQVLGRAYGYVTDETLAVRVDGSVVAYPKPLSIGLWPQVKTTEPASTLGLREAPDADLRLAALVLLDRRPGVEQPFVESVPIIEALPQLVPQVSHLRHLEHPLRTLLGAVIATGGVRRVVYSEASSLPSLIDELLRHADGDAPGLVDVPKMSERECGCFSSEVEKESDPSRVGEAEKYWRATYVDAVFVDDALMLLLPSRVVVLVGVGPTLWLAAEGLTQDELQEAALRELSDPPVGVDIAQVISDAVQGMVGTGILART